MRKSKYCVGGVVYVTSLKQYALVAAPTLSGTVAHLVTESNPGELIKYNIRTNKIIK